MPIDYSKFDSIGDSDEEAPEPGPSPGPNMAAGQDLHRLLQQALKQAADKEREDPQIGGASKNGAKKMYENLGAGDPYDDFDYEPDDLYDQGDLGNMYDEDNLDESLGRSQPLNYPEYRVEAWKLLCLRLTTTPTPAAMVPSALLYEAETHLVTQRFKQALIAALAVQMATAGQAPSQGQSSSSSASATQQQAMYGDWTASTTVIEMVCNYQLGDRDRAIQLRSQVQQMDQSLLSGHLAKQFQATSEVLDLVPQFLTMLQAAEQKELAAAREGARNAGW